MPDPHLPCRQVGIIRHFVSHTRLLPLPHLLGACTSRIVDCISRTRKPATTLSPSDVPPQHRQHVRVSRPPSICEVSIHLAESTGRALPAQHHQNSGDSGHYHHRGTVVLTEYSQGQAPFIPERQAQHQPKHIAHQG